MAQDAPRRRRARPVADAPVDALLARVDQLAKGWVIALLQDAPLSDAPRILGGPLPRDAPRVCEAVVRALADDAELRRLGPEGELRRLAGSVGPLTGARGAAGAARAVDTLSDVLWAAALEELRSPEPELVSALAERLTLVCALVREAAIEAVTGPGGGGSVGADTAPPGPEAPEHASSPPAPAAPFVPSPAEPPPAEPPPDREPPAETPPDREPPAETPPDREPPAETPPDREPPAAGWDPVPAGWDPVPAGWDPVPAGWDPAPAGGPPLAARGRTPLWMSALADEVRDSAGAGRPLSLLLAELEDADRVLASATPERAGAAVGDFLNALRGVLDGREILVCEEEARAWVIARETTRAGAHSLGARIAEAVGETTTLSGAPLAATVGVAVLGEDGQSVDELVDAAEEARFTASARGIEVSRRVPDRDRGES